MKLVFDFCKDSYRIETFCYLFPVDLFALPEFDELSFEAKALYAILLNMQLLHGNSDAMGRRYLRYTIGNLAGILGCGMGHASTVFHELACKSGIGLISQRKQKTGEVFLYIKDFRSGEVTKHEC